MENLTELKEYVFAQHIGQNVFMHKGVSGPVMVQPHLLKAPLEDCLQLRSLSSITDQEAIEVAKMNYPLFVGDIQKLIAVGKSILKGFELGHGCTNALAFISIYQYLQQQGFALPVYFKGVQYSVEKLIELGIYQIK